MVITPRYQPIIGLEIHAELETESKMFCSCPVVDSTESPPNIAVCPVCTGMPGVLPVVNRRAVAYALRVALALECEIAERSFFARKNYFYPDLPKGYQISQYEHPLARHGRLRVPTPEGERVVRIRRVHLEEDTGKLTHVNAEEAYSLVDLNRSGVPLLEIVSEPDLRSAEEVRAYATTLRSVLRYLEVNSGDMQKGVIRIEPNVSVRPTGEERLGTRVEIKNLNSFRALERSVAFEIQRQVQVLEAGGQVRQETVGWDEVEEVTFPQRTKEGEDDYRYFPEPDLPPLVVESEWVERIRADLPELPMDKLARFQESYGLNFYDADVLVADRAVADFFEATIMAAPDLSPKAVANWVTGELFGLLNQAGVSITEVRIRADALAELVGMVEGGEINNNTGKAVLAEMFESGMSALAIVEAGSLRQISDDETIARLVAQTLEDNPEQVATYLQGKTTVARWLFGQVMRATGGRANPQVVRQELEGQLAERRERQEGG
jgi:aspartyl-tRNA(Asn)/glutamyl-tRNA(Gln) amidotransferase subunit B